MGWEGGGGSVGGGGCRSRAEELGGEGLVLDRVEGGSCIFGGRGKASSFFSVCVYRPVPQFTSVLHASSQINAVTDPPPKEIYTKTKRHPRRFHTRARTRGFHLFSILMIFITHLTATTQPPICPPPPFPTRSGEGNPCAHTHISMPRPPPSIHPSPPQNNNAI